MSLRFFQFLHVNTSNIVCSYTYVCFGLFVFMFTLFVPSSGHQELKFSTVFLFCSRLTLSQSDMPFDPVSSGPVGCRRFVAPFGELIVHLFGHAKQQWSKCPSYVLWIMESILSLWPSAVLLSAGPGECLPVDKMPWRHSAALHTKLHMLLPDKLQEANH